LKFLNINNKIKLNFKNSFFLYDFLLKDLNYPLYLFFKKNIKSRKIFLKKINGSFKNIKNDSSKRDKNTTIINKFFNVSLKNGNKLNLNKN
jgi:hypothetical protein